MSTLLTEPAPQGQQAPAGNPPPASPPTGDQQAIQQVMDGPPEYIPVKFWDAEKKAPRVEDLGRSYVNLEKLLSSERVPLPQSDDDQEGWERWFRAAGRPEKPDDYSWERPDLPQDLPYDQETETAFRTWAHANGLTQRQARNLYDGYVKTQVERHKAWNEGRSKAKADAQMALQREHGDKYDGFVNSAKAAMTKYADDDFRKMLDETGLGNDPRMIRVFGKIGQTMMGDTRVTGQPPAPEPKPQDLDKAISDFRSKHEKALFNRDHPDHDLRLKEYNRLFEQRFGNALVIPGTAG